jgi:exonuclease VII large subunit
MSDIKERLDQAQKKADAIPDLDVRIFRDALARIEALEAQLARLQAHPSERYWEDRWRDEKMAHEALEAQLDDAKNDSLRLHREKCEALSRAIEAEAQLAAAQIESSCCQEDVGPGPCAPFEDIVKEKEELKAQLAEARAALTIAKEKLALFFKAIDKNDDGAIEYIGGLEYSLLMKRIDSALQQKDQT